MSASNNSSSSPPLRIAISKNQALIPLIKSSSSSEHVLARKLSEKDEKELEMFLNVLSPIEALKLTISIISNNVGMGIANRVLGQVVHTLEPRKDNSVASDVDSINMLPELKDVISKVNNYFVQQQNETFLHIPVKGYTLGQEYSLCMELSGRSPGVAKSTVAAKPFDDITIVLVGTNDNTTSNNHSNTKSESNSSTTASKKKKAPTEQEVMMKLLLEEGEQSEKKKQAKKSTSKKK
ncbi:hypothetical protein C9374_004796 [Naegleria lovaniensis]|uniref:Uncharacterized protein n=1 Tax=Naegleria lovaniensis TaxID=51637 RepID=A0AA88GKX8_NAELO|nr:uncharacterized protein C9374_004796 [Naegleria lovaniensis]KAG2382829.1 hypothetical protein C9374_004796 [Naegleria lovaniensis]